MTHACAAGQRWVEAFQLLSLMPLQRQEPRAAGFNACIVAASGHWPQAFSMVRSMSSARLVPDEISLGTLINACEACREGAFRLLMSPLVLDLRGVQI